MLLGVAAKLDDIRNGKEEILVAHVQKIRYTIPFTPLASRYTFFTSHSHFSPASTIKDKDVHLFYLSSTSAAFIRIGPDVDIFNIRKNPIFFLAQTNNARELITVPRAVFDRMADEVDISERDVVWLFQTIRCGSTIWSQIFNSLPEFSVISETQTLFYSIVEYTNVHNVQQFTKTPEYEKMALANIKWYIASTPQKTKVFWKTTLLDDYLPPIILKHFPHHKMMFAYRNTLPCAASYEKAFGWVPLVKMEIGYLVWDMLVPKPTSYHSRRGKIYYGSGYDPIKSDKAIQAAKPHNSSFEWFVLLWATKVSIMLQHIQSGIKIKPAKYEDLQGDPKGTIRGVFDYLGLSSDLMDLAYAAMELDSQAGLFFSQQNRSALESWCRTEAAVERCNQMLKIFDLPDLDSNFVVPDRTE